MIIVNIAKRNLKSIDWHNVPITGKKKIKDIFKLMLCEIYMKVRI